MHPFCLTKRRRIAVLDQQQHVHVFFNEFLHIVMSYMFPLPSHLLYLLPCLSLFSRLICTVPTAPTTGTFL